MKTTTIACAPLRNRLVLIILATAACGVSCSHSAPSPAPAPRQGDDSITGMLDRARAGSWFVRVTSAEGTAEGRVLETGTTTFNVAGSTIAYANVTRIERRMSRGSGTFAGGAIGAIALGMFGYGITETCESTSGCGGSIALVGGGAVVGGFLGMVIGTLARPGQDSWTTVW